MDMKEPLTNPKPFKTRTRVSFVILTWNAEKTIGPLLKYLRSRAVNGSPEIIVIDSSSTDRTCEIIQSYGAILHKIDRRSFSHSRTRNLGASLAEGKFIVFLTQDALPADNCWLSELLRPFEQIPHLAASYSRQVPAPEANPLEERDIFLGAPPADEIRSCDMNDPIRKADYLREIWRIIRFSNISACYRGDLLRENPFDERLPMVEDQEWAKRLLEKGYRIFYASKSVVRHSHDFGVRKTFERFYAYGVSYSRFMPPGAPSLLTCFAKGLREVSDDIAFILNKRGPIVSKLLWISRSPALRLAKQWGFYRGWQHG